MSALPVPSGRDRINSIASSSSFEGNLTPSSLGASKDAQPIAKKKRSGGGNKKGTSAERRATHNAVERARRETLNTRFLQLAANLPATAAVRRPSKSLIVNKSLAFVAESLAREPMYRGKIFDLAAQNEALRREANELRRQVGLEVHFEGPVNLDLPAPMADGTFDTVRRECIANLVAEGHDFAAAAEYDDDFSGSDGGRFVPDSAVDVSPYLSAQRYHPPAYGHAVGTPSDDGRPSTGYSHRPSTGYSSLPPSAMGMPQSASGLPPAPFSGAPQYNPITPTTQAIFNQMLGSLDIPPEGAHPYDQYAPAYSSENVNEDHHYMQAQLST
ncbi:hypothetical protein IE81DRAFT_242500 [Ceraceosorus guamensis]|uniref:BHLH domain-containing protein n=1 Tax=Ceraceosorus guamensis TaxID=1522189 RepID=A0A316W836_9BASI|nr:hypothetical protein IE81DRAFT_242500 [Ceraceosorus guamensis]PWN44901.1 hypothetical protein IE81DRAFT_242500 [Ceraceosorus guamensis]